MAMVPAENENPIDQARILQKCIKYIDIQAKKYPGKYLKKDVDALKAALGGAGHCNGLSGLWLYRKSQGEESILLGNLRLMSEWDEKPESLNEAENFLTQVFEQTINEMRWGQQQFSFLDKRPAIKKHKDDPHQELHLFAQSLAKRKMVQQHELATHLEVIKPKSDKESLREEFSLPFVYKKNELVEALKTVIQEGKLNYITSSTHAVAVMMKNNKYYFYDPNSKVGEVVFDDIAALEEALEVGLFKNFNRDTENMPVYIGVFDKVKPEDAPPAYPPNLKYKLIDKFLETNNDINRKSKTGINALIFAASFGDFEASDYLMKKGINLDETADQHSNALMAAILAGDFKLVKHLVNHGAELHEKNIQGRNILMLAVQAGQTEIAEYLVNKNIFDLKAKDKSGINITMLAAETGNLEIFNFLKTKMVFDLSLHNREGKSLLLMAAENGQLKMVQHLTEIMAADYNEKDANENTALMLSAQSGELSVVKYLCRVRGLNLEAKDNSGKSAVLLAVQNGHFEVAQYLIKEKGVDLTVTDDRGCNAVLIAAENQQLQMLKYLIERRHMDPNVLDSKGYSPLMVAVETGNLEIVQFLAGLKNINLDTKNSNDLTAIQIAKENGRDDIAAFLTQRKNEIEIEKIRSQNFLSRQFELSRLLSVATHLPEPEIEIEKKKETELKKEQDKTPPTIPEDDDSGFTI